MPQAILTMNHWAEGWLGAMTAVFWQSTLLVALAALVAWWLRRSSPAIRYWLWQIVAVKLVLMPFWTFAVPMPSWAQRVPPAQVISLQQPGDFGEGSSRPAARQPFASSEDSSTGTVSQTAPRWELLGTITWQAWLLLAWLGVVVWQVVRLLNQRLRLARLLKRGIPVDGQLADLVVELAGQMRLRHTPAVVSVAGDCPLFVCGLWRPRLILPSRLLASLSPAEQRQVILHELAHVRRHDLAWGWPVEIARIVYFFLPLVYWIAYQLRLERELCCDQLAMARSGHPAADYAQTLVQVVSHDSEPAAVQAAAIAAGLTGGHATKQGSQHNPNT